MKNVHVLSVTFVFCENFCDVYRNVKLNASFFTNRTTIFHIYILTLLSLKASDFIVAFFVPTYHKNNHF